MIRFDEYRNGKWTLKVTDDHDKVVSSLHSFAQQQGTTFSDEDVLDLLRDVDFFISGHFSTHKAYHEEIVKWFKDNSCGDDLHERVLCQAFQRLLKENGLWSTFIQSRLLHYNNNNY